MKKLFVNPKGTIIIEDVKDPRIETKGLLVKTSYTLISSGTELAGIQVAKLMDFSISGILKNFLKSKEYRRRIFQEIKGKSLKNIFFFYKLHSKKSEHKNFKSPSLGLMSLGYSSSGIVLESNIQGYEKGNRVACAGSNHAEMIFSPKNLSSKVPDNVSLEEASFISLGAIALHGINRADIKPGENVGIIGTGLVGLLVIQLAKVKGAKVFAFDFINKRLNLAKSLGADFIINPLNHNSIKKVNEETNSLGLDSIVICASSKTAKPLEDAIDLIRENGKVVMVGAFSISVDRSKVYYKEVDLLISRSYGPGRYDIDYEYYGIDYPKEKVSWTEQDNIKLFLKLISEKKVDVKPLISEIIPFENASSAYQKLANDPINNIAVLLKFTKEIDTIQVIEKKKLDKKVKKLNIGLIGCGAFAQENHLPYLLSNPHCKIKGICTQHQKTADICKEKFHPEYVTTNFKKILKDPEIDIVFIYTRHDSHEKFTIKALKNGKNVFSEKPMGITSEQCRNVYKAVRESNKIYTIGFNRRYSPFIQFTKELLEKRDNPIILNYRIATNFLTSNHWLFDPKVGGGPLIGELCHFTDLVLYLMNSNPIELVAKGGSMSHTGIKVFDSCAVIIIFQNGSVANLIYTDLSGPEMPKERIEIFSGESAIIIDDFKEMKTSGFDTGNLILDEQDKGHKNEINNVILSNLGLEDPLVNAKDALKAMELCFKTIESIKINQSIKLLEIFNE